MKKHERDCRDGAFILPDTVLAFQDAIFPLMHDARNMSPTPQRQLRVVVSRYLASQKPPEPPNTHLSLKQALLRNNRGLAHTSTWRPFLPPPTLFFSHSQFFTLLPPSLVRSVSNAMRGQWSHVYDKQKVSSPYPALLTSSPPLERRSWPRSPRAVCTQGCLCAGVR